MIFRCWSHLEFQAYTQYSRKFGGQFQVHLEPGRKRWFLQKFYSILNMKCISSWHYYNFLCWWGQYGLEISKPSGNLRQTPSFRGIARLKHLKIAQFRRKYFGCSSKISGKFRSAFFESRRARLWIHCFWPDTIFFHMCSKYRAFLSFYFSNFDSLRHSKNQCKKFQNLQVRIIYFQFGP